MILSLQRYVGECRMKVVSTKISLFGGRKVFLENEISKSGSYFISFYCRLATCFATIFNTYRRTRE